MIVNFNREGMSNWSKEGSDLDVIEVVAGSGSDSEMYYRCIIIDIIDGSFSTPLLNAPECTVLDGTIPPGWECEVSGSSMSIAPAAFQKPDFWELLYNDDDETAKQEWIEAIHEVRAFNAQRRGEGKDRS